MLFKDKNNEYKSLIEEIINDSIRQFNSDSTNLAEAMRYSLLSGGKRLRPVLFIAAYEMNGAKIDKAVKKLCFAIEALHTYTLIHDDLPCMDDDDERRGMPSCHMKFGQAHALLAGDALLNLSFESALEAVGIRSEFLSAVKFFFQQTGMSGVVGGQSLEFESKPLTEELSLKIIENKTAALFKAAVVMGGMCAGMPQEKVVLLESFGYNYGMAFQLKDDLSDLNDASFVKIGGVARVAGLFEKYCGKAIAAAEKLNSKFFTEAINTLIF